MNLIDGGLIITLTASNGTRLAEARQSLNGPGWEVQEGYRTVRADDRNAALAYLTIQMRFLSTYAVSA